MKIDELKSLWPALTAIVLLSGFYYTTQLRLDRLELSVEQLTIQVDKNDVLSDDVKALKRKVNKLSKTR